jgi:hypothetical protein
MSAQLGPYLSMPWLVNDYFSQISCVPLGSIGRGSAPPDAVSPLGTGLTGSVKIPPTFNDYKSFVFSNIFLAHSG